MKIYKITEQILVLKTTFIFLTFAVLTGCTSLRMDVALRGIMLDDDKMTLDGDTFDIREKIGDSLLIVWNYTQSYDRTPYYLLKYECNGFYYPQICATDITPITNTTNYVSIDEEKVYDIKAERYYSHLHVVRLVYITLANGKSCVFSQVLIQFVSLTGNVSDFKMMYIVENRRIME